MYRKAIPYIGTKIIFLPLFSHSSTQKAPLRTYSTTFSVEISRRIFLDRSQGLKCMKNVSFLFYSVPSLFWFFLSSAHQRPQGPVGRFFANYISCESKAACKVSKKLVFLVHFRPWDLSRKMRREILIEFSSGIIDFENKSISIVQKQWKFRISVPM